MNLIEQLGGYDEAKEYLANLEKIPMHEQTEDTLTCLPDMLLQYRRENNIFEVGDKIVYLNEPILRYVTDVQTIKKVGKNSVWAYKKDRCNFATEVHFHQIRHATPKEIGQGFRDE